MGAIRHTITRAEHVLEPSHLVGRAPPPKCSLVLTAPYVSLVHAELRFRGDVWEVKDLGSRNGTYLDGRRIEPSVACEIAKGSILAFGKPEEQWQMIDHGPPPVMAVPLGGGAPVVLDGELLALPSNDDPRATIYRTIEGAWVIEPIDGAPTSLVHLQTFEAAGHMWRFLSPEVSPSTLAIGGTIGMGLEVRKLHLHFEVSRDEEHVHLRASSGARDVDLGSRRHNYLLLTLARRRLADAAEGLPETSCGWIDTDDLAHDPTMSQVQLNVNVFRIRQQFAKVGVLDAAAIVERREQQLRLGTSLVTTTTV